MYQIIDIKMKKILFLSLAVASIFISPALSLLLGVIFALTLGSEFDKYTSKASSYLLKIAVVGLGFGMNIIDSLQSSSEGIIFTIFSVVLVMCSGVLLSKYFGVGRKLGYLISSGTAICGGSAIAAIAPVIKSNSKETSMSLAVVFTLNAVAMLIFPTIGEMLELTQQQFGMWAAIAIHDTSAVVGAAKMYGEEALQIATTVKLSRALWIIPLSVVSTFVFKAKDGEKGKVSIPWFILLFVIAMTINTYFPINDVISNILKSASHKILSLTLFFIGSTLSLTTIRSAGIKPILLGVTLWILISIVTLMVILIL